MWGSLRGSGQRLQVCAQVSRQPPGFEKAGCGGGSWLCRCILFLHRSISNSATFKWALSHRRPPHSRPCLEAGHNSNPTADHKSQALLPRQTDQWVYNRTTQECLSHPQAGQVPWPALKGSLRLDQCLLPAILRRFSLATLPKCRRPHTLALRLVCRGLLLVLGVSRQTLAPPTRGLALIVRLQRNMACRQVPVGHHQRQIAGFILDSRRPLVWKVRQHLEGCSSQAWVMPTRSTCHQLHGTLTKN